MLLALTPVLALLAATLIGMLGHSLGLFATSTVSLSNRAASGVLSTTILWFIAFFVRAMLRDSERHTAEREARDALLRDQNIELWRSRQLHEHAVQEKAAAMLTVLRQRPLHVRLHTLLRGRE
jgi:hypothetical protein